MIVNKHYILVEEKKYYSINEGVYFINSITNKTAHTAYGDFHVDSFTVNESKRIDDYLEIMLRKVYK